MKSNSLLALMVLSAAATCLMPVLGLLLRFQPLFIHGLHVRASSAEINCYIVGTLYAGVFLICSLLQTCNCFEKSQEDFQDDVAKRNERYKLPFVELESKEFVRAMDAMDRRTAVTPVPKKGLELPTSFFSKAAAV